MRDKELRDKIYSRENLFLFDSDYLLDPYPYYAYLRQERPFLWLDAKQSWFITRYRDVKNLLLNQNLSVQREKRKITSLPTDQRSQLADLKRFYERWLLYLDPPDHTKLRRAVNREFVEEAVKSCSQRTREKIRTLLDMLDINSEVDIKTAFADELGLTVVSSFLGVSGDQYEFVKKASQSIIDFVVGRSEGFEAGLEAQQAMWELSRYFEYLISEEYEPGQHSVLDTMKQELARGNLTRHDLFSIYASILTDGHEPITNSILNSVLALLRDKRLIDTIDFDPMIVPSAVEEFLRYDSAFQFSQRVVKLPFEYEGVQFKQGQRVLLMLGSANRDETMFENPDQVILTRENNKHLAFGLGTHFCLGAQLARQTLRIVLEEMTPFLREMIIVPTERLGYEPSFAIRSLQSLRITRDIR